MNHLGARKIMIVLAMGIAYGLVFFDQTATPVALVAVQRSLSLSSVAQHWVINALMLSTAVFLVLGGRLVDIFGSRRIFLFGISGFVVAAISNALAINGVSLLISRAVQGFFCGMFIPAVGPIVINAFSEEKSGKAIGYFAAVAAIFIAIGPFIGGFITEYYNWRILFLLSVPLAIFSLLLACFNLPQRSLKNLRFKLDWLGFLLLAITVVAVIFALMNGGEFGWSSTIIIALFCIALITFIGFITVEKKATEPLVNLNFFRHKKHLFLLLILFSVQICIMARVFWPIFFQLILNYSAFQAGLLLLPATAPTLFMAPIAGFLHDRYGVRVPIIIGEVLLAISLFSIALFAATLTLWKILFATLCFGLGLPLIEVVLFAAILSLANPKHRGVFAGIFSEVGQLGCAFGVAVLSAVLTNIERYHFVIKFPKLAGLSVSGILANTAVKQHLQQQVMHFAILAYNSGFRVAMFMAMAFAVIGLLLAWIKILR